jgi:hypothetical protein
VPQTKKEKHKDVIMGTREQIEKKPRRQKWADKLGDGGGNEGKANISGFGESKI